MRFYWVSNRVNQGHYLVYWGILKDNLAVYLTKYHPTKHHSATRGTYLVPTADSSEHACYQVPRDLRGCVKPPPPAQETGDGRTRSPPPRNGRSTDGYRHAISYRQY